MRPETLETLRGLLLSWWPEIMGVIIGTLIGISGWMSNR